MPTIDLTTYSDDDLDQLRRDVIIEIERRALIRTAEATAAQLAAQYAEAVHDEPAIGWEPGLVVGPGRTVTEDGVEYRNTSGAWLSVPPSAYPLGYQMTTPPDTEEVPAFKAGEQVQPGDLRAYNGKVWRCLQPHTTADHWAPDVAVSLWTLA